MTFKKSVEIEGGSYVGMSNCYLCNKPKEILLDRRLKNSLPQSAIYNKEPCDKCKKYMETGIIFIGVKDNEQNHENPYRTGEWCVLKEEAVKSMPMNDELKTSILKMRVAFVEQEVLKRFGILDLIKKTSKTE